MTIKEYGKLMNNDNDVCLRIDKYMGKEIALSDSELNKLLEGAENVICDYRALCNSFVERVDIERAVCKKF